jgi:NAD(P)-dependent dehydrogenase (short-subunit alcohol dehydrogenase family)
MYSASKAAVRNLARSWAQDLRGTGIRVNVLSPGPTLTELAAEVVGRDAMIEMGAATPIGHVGDPSEVAAAAAFLASADSSFMTGSELFTDGGLAQI